jgi:hypothetical protein
MSRIKIYGHAHNVSKKESKGFKKGYRHNITLKCREK